MAVSRTIAATPPVVDRRARAQRRPRCSSSWRSCLLVLLVVVFALPRRRETARLAGCRRNLMQIGVALALYDESEGSLPTVPRLGTDPAATGGPLKAILDALGLPDLTGAVGRRQTSRRPGRDSVPEERPVPASSARATGPTSRRLPRPGLLPGDDRRRRRRARTAGSRPAGRSGSSEIEAGDGLGFTAAFSERLLGTRRARRAAAPPIISWRPARSATRAARPPAPRPGGATPGRSGPRRAGGRPSTTTR